MLLRLDRHHPATRALEDHVDSCKYALRPSGSARLPAPPGAPTTLPPRPPPFSRSLQRRIPGLQKVQKRRRLGLSRQQGAARPVLSYALFIPCLVPYLTAPINALNKVPRDRPGRPTLPPPSQITLANPASRPMSAPCLPPHVCRSPRARNSKSSKARPNPNPSPNPHQTNLPARNSKSWKARAPRRSRRCARYPRRRRPTRSASRPTAGSAGPTSTDRVRASPCPSSESVLATPCLFPSPSLFGALIYFRARPCHALAVACHCLA